MHYSHSPGTGGMLSALPKLIVILTVLGGLVAFGLSRVPLQLAEADRVRKETAWESQVREHIELPYLEQKRSLEYAREQAETEAFVAQLAEEDRVRRERNDQRLRAEAMLRYSGVFVLLLFGCIVAISLGLAVAKTLFDKVDQKTDLPVATMPAANRQESTPHDAFDPLRDDDEYRRWRIAKARENEQASRQSVQTLTRRSGRDGHNGSAA